MFRISVTTCALKVGKDAGLLLSSLALSAVMVSVFTCSAPKKRIVVFSVRRNINVML